MFYDNLKRICDDKNIKITPLVLECGGTKGVIGGWKKGAAPNSDIVMSLSVRLNVPTDELLFGETKKTSSLELSNDEQELLRYYKQLDERGKGIVYGEAKGLYSLRNLIKNESKKDSSTPKAEHPIAVRKIDLFSLPVSAGSGVYLDGNDKDEMEIEDNPNTKEADFALRVSGNSMEPAYYNGDILLIRSQPTIKIGEIGIFVLNGEGFVKELGCDRLISLNSAYEDILFSENDSIYCMGKVIGVSNERN